MVEEESFLNALGLDIALLLLIAVVSVCVVTHVILAADRWKLTRIHSFIRSSLYIPWLIYVHGSETPLTVTGETLNYYELMWARSSYLLRKAETLRYEHSIPLLVVTAAYMFGMFFFVLAYETRLTSILTATIKRGYDFCNFGQLLPLLESGKWQALLLRGGYRPEEFCVGEDQCARAAAYAQRTALHPMVGFEALIGRPNTLILTTRNNDLQTVFYQSRKNEILFIPDDLLTRQQLSFAISKRIPHHIVERLNRAIALVYQAIFQVESRYTPWEMRFDRKADNTYMVLQLRNYGVIFKVYGTLILIACIVLLVEMAVHRAKNKVIR